MNMYRSGNHLSVAVAESDPPLSMPVARNGSMRGLRWCLFVGLVCAPLLDGGMRLFGARIIVFQAYFVPLLIMALLAFSKERSRSLLTSVPVALALVLLFVSWFVASILALHFDVALSGALRNAELLLFALMLAGTIRRPADVRLYLLGFLGAIAWVSIVGWVQSIFGNDALRIRAATQVNALHYFGTSGAFGERTVTAFGDPIMSGHFLAVGMCAALGWSLSTRNGRERFWLLVVAAMALGPLLTSASRGPIAAAFITITLLALFSGALKKTVVIVLVLAGILATVYWQEILTILNMVSMLHVSLDRLAYGLETNRWAYWGYILSMAKSFPLGVGLGNFATTAPRFVPSYLLYVGSAGQFKADMHAESMYLTQLIEIGWLGFVAFVGLVVMSVSNIWRLLLGTARTSSPTERAMYGSVAGGWTCLALSMGTMYGYDNVSIAMLLWFFVGMSIALPYGRRIRLFV